MSHVSLTLTLTQRQQSYSSSCSYVVPLVLVEFGVTQTPLRHPLGGLRRDASRERLVLCVRVQYVRVGAACLSVSYNRISTCLCS